jgi:hypothetical protein
VAQNVVKFYPKDAAKNPDNVLERAVGVYDQVFVIGYDKDGKLDVRASLNFKMKDIFFAMEAFKHKVLRGDYDERLEDLEEADYD